MDSDRTNSAVPTRRTILAGGAGVILAMTMIPRALAAPEDMASAIKDAFGSAEIKPGRVLLELPSLAESGNSVPMTVTVESAMTETDFVEKICLFSEKNPSANIVHFQLGPQAGRARVQTNIRLADTQTVVAIARLADGTCWSGTANVIVTSAACIDES